LHELSQELFGNIPIGLILAYAIREHLTIDALKDAMLSYKKACDERRREYSHLFTTTVGDTTAITEQD
jgi:hypothetical protein